MISTGCNEVAEGGEEEPRNGFGKGVSAPKNRHYVG